MVPECVLGDTLWADTHTVDTLDTVECAVPVGLRYMCGRCDVSVYYDTARVQSRCAAKL